MYHIIGYQTNPITGETQYQILCDTAADLPASPVSDNGYGGEIGQGSKAVIIADGSCYIADSNRQWIYQPNPNAWVNVYTKSEIDEMITETYETIAYYHTTLVSDTGEITFYAFDGYIGTWTIFGNGQQSGTPSPQNIIMPAFCGVRTGQLFYTRLASKNVAPTGYISNVSGYDIMIGKVSPGQEYTASKCNGVYGFFDRPPLDGSVQAIDKTRHAFLGGTLTFTAPAGCYYVAVRCKSGEEKQMLNLGSTALPYEPYGWAEKITCAGQTVPVYLGQTQTVRRVKKLVLTGEENIETRTSAQTGNVVMCLDVSGYMQSTDYTPLSSHYIGLSAISGIEAFVTSGTFAFLVSGSGSNFMYIFDNRYTTAADFKAWLASEYAAGTPVTVWYVLATPETAIVNEPIAKIGDYADELHSEDAGVAIPTAKGQNTLTVDTILKPSRIEIQG